jgi:hypothetical protein
MVALDPQPLGIRWLKFWSLAGLPVGGIIVFLVFLDVPVFRYEIVPLAMLFFGVAIGLHKRKLWAWQLNWLVLAFVFVALLVPTPIRDPHGGYTIPIMQGVLDVLSIDWHHERMRDLAVPVALRLVVASVAWAWPNWIYWKKREGLFS